MMEKEDDKIRNIYQLPMPSARTGSLFNAHSYPTKISPEAVVPYILAHTRPNDIVYDGFSGSGVLGLAAKLCQLPSPAIKKIVDERMTDAEWGVRNSVLCDLSELACFISKNLLNPPDPVQFQEAAEDLLKVLQDRCGWMYALSGEGNEIRYTIWTEYVACPNCGFEMSFWDMAVKLEVPEISSVGSCAACSSQINLSKAGRITESYEDTLLGRHITTRKRRPAYVYGRLGAKNWKRPAREEDLSLVAKISALDFPSYSPNVSILASKDAVSGNWGELYRSGYHEGITHLHHFYTKRNFLVLSEAWELCNQYPENLREALKFLISSYNASHSTLMTRVVCKKASKDLVVTSAQPAALYISGLPVEKNIISGLRKKLKTIVNAFSEIKNLDQGGSIVICGSSTSVDLPSDTVDYIFTDPPFGDNIQYSEVNFIAEAWLGKLTTPQNEAIVSKYQNKNVDTYSELLTSAFKENYRLLKPGKYMTVIFHSTQPKVWEALRRAWEMTGFEMVGGSVLDKTQGSFKQVTASDVVQGDPIILLRKPVGGDIGWDPKFVNNAPLSEAGVLDLIDARLKLLPNNSSERNRQKLFSYLVLQCLHNKQPVPLSAKKFFLLLDIHYTADRDLYLKRKYE